MSKKIGEERGLCKVFISGSREIQDVHEFTPDILRALVDIKESNLEVIIGDSEKGIDNEIADYYRDYKNVTVYSIKEKARIKIEKIWKFNHVPVSPLLKLSGKERQTKKDIELANNADFGLVIWQPTYLHPRFKKITVSSGSLRNMVQMLIQGKGIKLFVSEEKGDKFRMSVLKKISDLDSVISNLSVNQIIVNSKYKELKKHEKLENKQAVSYKKKNEKLQKQQSLF